MKYLKAKMERLNIKISLDMGGCWRSLEKVSNFFTRFQFGEILNFSKLISWVLKIYISNLL